MKFDKKIAEAIKLELEKQLSSEVFEEHLVTKKMFGGLAFMVHGKMLATASGRDGVMVMVRIGKERQDALLPASGASVTVMKGIPQKGYVDLDEEGVKALSFWIKEAIAFNDELMT